MASKDNVKLLGAWTSPFVMRVQIALRIKSIEYNFLEETFGSKSDLLLKSNPVHKKMPVLIHESKPISESLVILQYIDQVWTTSGPSLLPTDPYDRAMARFWAAYIDDHWFRALSRIALDRAEPAAVEPVAAGLVVLEEAFEKCSEGKGFFGGGGIGYVDIVLGSLLGWVRVSERVNEVKLLDEDKTPCLARWAQRFCADEVVKQFMPDTERLMEFGKLVLATLRAAAPAPAPAPAPSQ